MDYRSNSGGQARMMHGDKPNDERIEPLDLTKKSDAIEVNPINFNTVGSHSESFTFTEMPSRSNKSSYTSRSSTLPWQSNNSTLPWQSDGSNKSSNYSILLSYDSSLSSYDSSRSSYDSSQSSYISRSSIALQSFEMHRNNSNYISSFHKDQNKPKRKVPIQDQDDLYRQKRDRNNKSAKKSRDKKKREVQFLKEHVNYMEKVVENLILSRAKM